MPKKPLAQVLVNIRNEFIERYPENRREIIELIETTHRLCLATFRTSNLKAESLRYIKGQIDEYMFWKIEVASLAEEYRAAINLLCYQWADPGLDMIEWGVVDDELPELPEILREKQALRDEAKRVYDEEFMGGERLFLTDPQVQEEWVVRMYNYAKRLEEAGWYDLARHFYMQAHEISAPIVDGQIQEGKCTFAHAAIAYADIHERLGHERDYAGGYPEPELTPKSYEWLAKAHMEADRLDDLLFACKDGIRLGEEDPNTDPKTMGSLWRMRAFTIIGKPHWIPNYLLKAMTYDPANPEHQWTMVEIYLKGLFTESLGLIGIYARGALGLLSVPMDQFKNVPKPLAGEKKALYVQEIRHYQEKIEAALDGTADFPDIDDENIDLAIEYYNHFLGLVMKMEQVDDGDFDVTISLALGYLYKNLAELTERSHGAYPSNEEIALEINLYNQSAQHLDEYVGHYAYRLLTKVRWSDDYKRARQALGKVRRKMQRKGAALPEGYNVETLEPPEPLIK